MQHMIVVLVAQVIGDVGEGGTGCFGHSVVDDHQIIFLDQGHLRSLLNVPLLNLSYLMSGNDSFCNGGGEDEETLMQNTFQKLK